MLFVVYTLFCDTFFKLLLFFQTTKSFQSPPSFASLYFFKAPLSGFKVFLLKYLSDWNKTFTTLILHIGLHSDKVWRILNFLILYVLPDYYRQPLFNCVVICVHPFIARTSAKSSRFVRVNKHSRHCWVLTQLCHCINICSLLCSTPERIILACVTAQRK